MAHVKALRPAIEADALEVIRNAGSIESVMALAALLGWERTRTQRALARWQRDGVVVLKPGGPGGRTIIEYVCTPAHQPAGPDAYPNAQPTQVAAHPAQGASHPDICPDAHPARVDTQPDAHPAQRTGPVQVDAHHAAHPAQPIPGWFQWAFKNGLMEWCQIVFGILVGASSIALFGASVFLNAAFWPGLAQSEDAKAVLAVFGFTVEVCNFTIPSAASLASMSRSFRRGLWVLLALTMVTAGITGSSFVRSNLGAAEVSRDQVNKERDRLQGIIGSAAVPVSDAAVADARSRVRSAETLRKSTCAPTKSLDLDECSKAKAEVLKAEAALTTENTKHTAAIAAAEERHRKDVADARSALDRLPMISADKNVVLAGVAQSSPGHLKHW
jgi:hypothetical protein